MQILHTVTSTFRGRGMSFAQLQASSTRTPTQRSVDKWGLYKQLCIAKEVFCLNDRCLAVLSSLLSFYPGDEICEKNGLVVFPSNRQLSLRAHGMAESTLRRHLTALVSAGIIARRDSPNGKRYAHKDTAGEVEEAFGFSFAPLLDRADKIAQAAEMVRADAKLLRRTREQITLQRRDLAHLFEAAKADTHSGVWRDAFDRFRSIVTSIPRRASIGDLEPILKQLVSLRAEMDKMLISLKNDLKMSANDRQNERHQYESLPESLIESKNVKKNDLKKHFPLETKRSNISVIQPPPRTVSLEIVLRTCPDIRDYASNGISSWRDLADVSHMVADFLGIARSAYLEANQIMGREGVSAVIAWILQRADSIKSPGGYLRSLTQKARAGGFSITQIFMSSLKNETFRWNDPAPIGHHGR